MNTTSPAPSPKQQLAEFLLRNNGGLEKFVADRRSGGRSWRLISRDLFLATEHQADVSSETLRSWFPEFADDPPAATGDTAA